MKDLFEELNKAVPANGGTKASKWEILTKGKTSSRGSQIHQHPLTLYLPAIDHIRSSQQQEHRLQHEVNRLRADVDYARDTQKENEMLKSEVQVMHEHLRRLDPNGTHVYGQFSSRINQGQDQSRQPNGSSGISLPPLNPPNSSNSQHPPYGSSGPGAMQGVEYGYGQAR